MELVRLEDNAGYPGGMNAGLKRTKGQFIFLVSSDILVPPGTFSRLCGAMEADAAAGLIAPVSNAAGNEQQIFMEPDLSVTDVLDKGGLYADAGDRSVSCFSAYRLDFCCVCVRRNVYDQLGGFDEAYIPGYYEDFDYSLLVRNAGYEVLIAENAFVYHEGGGTFGKVSKEKKRLIKRNKSYFLAKHGSGVRLPHVRDANLDVLEQYVKRLGEGGPVPPLRIRNRLRLARADLPRSFFKKRRYLRRLALLEDRLGSFLDGVGA